MLGVVGVLIVATLITAGVYSGDETVAKADDTAVSADVELPSDVPEPEPAPLPRRTAIAPAPAPAPAPALRTASLPYAPTVAPTVEATPVAAVVRESNPEPVVQPKAELQAEAVEARATQATITGCLARDDDRYVLKNVSGDDAPKSRSWKSGFLRKRSLTVELIDPAATNRLASYVGRQIETTGALDDREMRVKSLRVQGAC